MVFIAASSLDRAAHCAFPRLGGAVNRGVRTQFIHMQIFVINAQKNVSCHVR